MDIATFGPHIAKEFSQKSTYLKDLENAQDVLRGAATTKLEFQMCHALVHKGPKEAITEVKAKEREYSTRFKLVRQDNVHPALLAWRDSVAAML